MRLASGASRGSPNPPATLGRAQPARQLDQRERVAAGLAEDPGPHPSRRAAPGSSRPAAAGPRRRPAPRSPAPAALGARARRRTRAARTPIPAAPPAAGAPRTRASAPDTRSSHCASSTMHTSGCSSAASASRLRTASPTRKRSGGGPALRPNAVLSASRCGLGSCPRRPSIGAHSACSPANASSISDSTPAARAIRHPSAAPDSAAAGRSCRPPPRRAGPAPGSGPRALPRRVAPATSRSRTRSSNPRRERWLLEHADERRVGPRLDGAAPVSVPRRILPSRARHSRYARGRDQVFRD